MKSSLLLSNSIVWAHWLSFSCSFPHSIMLVLLGFDWRNIGASPSSSSKWLYYAWRWIFFVSFVLSCHFYNFIITYRILSLWASTFSSLDAWIAAFWSKQSQISSFWWTFGITLLRKCFSRFLFAGADFWFPQWFSSTARNNFVGCLSKGFVVHDLKSSSLK